MTSETYVSVKDQNGVPTRTLAVTPEDKKRVINQSISKIIKTPLAEPFMRGGLGSRTHLVPMEPNDEATQLVALYYATSSVEALEKRVTLVDSFTKGEDTEIIVSLVYKIKDHDEAGVADILFNGDRA
jgi:phage baseplate assembly protein W